MTSLPVSPLRQRMIEDMSLRQFGPKTQADYVRARRWSDGGEGTPLSLAQASSRLSGKNSDMLATWDLKSAR
jgi:hypothetical protein